MNTNEYLNEILSAQDLKDDSAELKELQTERANVEKLLRGKFGSTPTIRYGGSKAKGTLIKESYDLDLPCYFPSDSNVAGENLEDIYRNVRDALREKYYVDEKTSALRLSSKDPKTLKRDFHIDVVPGRFTDDKKSDCFIYQKSAEKCRLKTNLDVHIEHIKNSGVLDAIRLLKLWKTRKGLHIKQFVFELMIVKLLDDMKTKPLAEQLTHFWTKVKDASDPINVEDPANPSGNDLSTTIKNAWPEISAVSASTLDVMSTSGWEGIFGPVPKSSSDVAEKAQRAAASVSASSKPWCENA